MAYAVKRTYGKNGHDYLHAWCKDWGTSCMGSLSLAMIFKTKTEADLAASRAQRYCKGAGGHPPQGITFTAVPV